MANRGNRPFSRSYLPYTSVRSTESITESSHWSVHSLSSMSMRTGGLDAFWRTPPKPVPRRTRRWNHLRRRFQDLVQGRRFIPNRRVGTCIVMISACLLLMTGFHLRDHRWVVSMDSLLDPHEPIRPALWNSNHNKIDPARWLKENSNDKYAVSPNGFPQFHKTELGGRPRAAIISLVRNSELQGMLQSMRQLEYRWNRKYQYPWVFFNDEPFLEEFKAATQNLTSADCFYEIVPKEHWSLPDWVDENRFMTGLEYLGAIGVGKGWMVSYHHMCRWNSGFFYQHPALNDFDWYWRVEPDVHFFCDINYDVFRFMRDNNMKYGFNMNILDDARSFPSLWTKTRDFITSNPFLLHPESDLSWLIDDQTHEYNNCQFFSNFEIGSLNFWRSPQNKAYFDYLDRSGGFYYERFGDAPVHTLSVAMFAPKREVWFFRDLGYQHDINHQCPSKKESKCSCSPTRLDENFYKLVPLESPQLKPKDTCIRQWLGGDWLKKKDGWTMEGEKAFGGDGYHGYVLSGED